jgi:hypothetical protein
MMILFLWCLFGATVAQNQTLFVDGGWIVPANTTSDGSMQRPFLNLSSVAAAINDWGMQGLDMALVVVHMAPRLYTGPANCFQVLNLLMMAEFELHGAWTNGSTLGGTSARHGDVRVCQYGAAQHAATDVAGALFGARERFEMQRCDVSPLDAPHVRCRVAHLRCDASTIQRQSPHPNRSHYVRCMPYHRPAARHLRRRGAQHGAAPQRHRCDVPTSSLSRQRRQCHGATVIGWFSSVAERKAHSPLMVLARGYCDVGATRSTVTDSIVPEQHARGCGVHPTSSTAVHSRATCAPTAPSAAARSTVSGGDLTAVNCTFIRQHRPHVRWRRFCASLALP